MCEPSPVALRLWHDTSVRYGPRVSYLGIVGDQAHSQRTSGHNCGARQEAPIAGVDYDDRYAHALDIKVGRDRALALAIVALLLLDPRTRYVIFDGVGYYPAHRGGGTFPSFDHEEHVHWSGMPGTTFDTRPFYAAAGGVIDPEEAEIMGALDKIAQWHRDTRRIVTAATLDGVHDMLKVERANNGRKHQRTREVIVDKVADLLDAQTEDEPVDRAKLRAAVAEAVELDTEADDATDGELDAIAVKYTQQADAQPVE